jgi:hypothetical protein
VGAFALLVQTQTFYGAYNVEDGGWLPSAATVAQLQSQCPTTRIFAYPAYNRSNGLDDLALGLKINRVSYGYWENDYLQGFVAGLNSRGGRSLPKCHMDRKYVVFRDRAIRRQFILRELQISVKARLN